MSAEMFVANSFADQASRDQWDPVTHGVLVSEALRARSGAYAPYSRFLVGAAVVTADRQRYSGCNIENASFGATICAERVAIMKAISAGHREIVAIAVVADYFEPVPPCGICRQVMSEFGKNAIVIMANSAGMVSIKDLKELFPGMFSLKKEDKSGI